MADSDPGVRSQGSILNLKEGLSDALDAIQSSGKFAAFGQLDSFVDPDVFVPGIGSIRLPLQEQTARSLIQTCHQAPFGKGEQTIIDLSVRNTWELDANQFELRNPAWPKYIKQITRSALKELGFDEEDMFGVRAELYKLLLSEKAPGMFGTLVICLPSPHEGGHVKLQHIEETKVFRTDLSNPSYACWYSDVVHEVTRLSNGYRFILTFNLTADPQGARPSAKMNFNVHEGLRRLLKQWQSDISSSKGSSYNRVIHLLDHEYTEQGLKLQSLKGRDLDVVRALCEACSATDILCFLASCEKEVYGSCEENFGYSSRFRHYGSEYSDDYHPIVDVCDTSLRLNRIVDMNGKLVAENVDINEEDFLEENPFEDKTPDDEDYSGYTGNEGVSATHWYRDTVIVIVPKPAVADFLMKGSALRNPTPSWSYNYDPKPSFDAEKLFSYFQRLLEAEPDDSNHANSLRKVCQKVLSDQAIFSEAVIHLAIEIAAQLGDLDLLELAVSSHQGHLTAAIVLTVGKHLSSVTLGHFKKVLTKPINSLKKLYKRHEVIRSLTTALLEERVDLPKQDVDAKIDWLASTMDELLAASDALEAEDAEALFEMLDAPRSPNNFLDRLEVIVQRNHGRTLFMINFLAGLCQNGLGVRYGFPQERASSIFKSQFPEFYAHFDIHPSIEAQNETAQPARSILPALSYLSHTQPPRAEGPMIAAHWEAVSNASVKLPHLFRQTLELCLHGQANAMLNVIGHAAGTYDVNYFKHLFLPFLRGMLPVWKEKGIALSNPNCRGLYQSVLGSYSRRFVGEKPPCPEQDWARIRVPCPCRDCQTLNSFITNPTQRVGRFPIGKSRRMHIHQQLDGAKGTYTHITERIGNPQTLVVTKTRTEWESGVSAWETRRAEARDEFKSYGLETLRELLGDQFQNITGLSNAESGDEAAKRQKVGATRSGDHHRILSSNLHAQNVGDAVTAGGAGTKRKHVEIIDLTEE